MGSLFPDIDTYSKMQKIFWLGLIGFIPLALITNHQPLFWCLSATCLVLLIIQHRTLTHRIWFIFAFPFIITSFAIYKQLLPLPQIISACIFFIAGGLNHRLLDFGFYRFFSRK
jgi:membrane-bound metal-dependent hydrolase YbcI (DUF457 family)